MTDLKITGVYCAAVTPVTDDLAPDHAAFVAHCRRLLDDGCDGIAMLGTTGEANSFSSTERRALLEAAIAGGIPAERLLPGTGVAALTETVELTRHALSLGVNRVVMLPPFYYKGISDDGLFASYAEIVERIGDARLQVVLYHIPQFSAVPITFPVIARLRARYPAVFVGLKDSAGELDHMVALVEAFPGFAVLAGADPLRAADVDEAQARVVAMRGRVSKFAQIASIKALIASQTGHASWRKLRPPLLALSDAEIAQL